MSLITPNLADFSARIYTYDQISHHLWRKRCSGALYWVTRQPRNCPNRPVSTDTNSTSSSSSQRHGYLESWQGWYPGKRSLSTAFPDRSWTVGSMNIITSDMSQIVFLRKPGSNLALQLLLKMKQTPGVGAWYGRACHGMLCALPSEGVALLPLKEEILSSSLIQPGESEPDHCSSSPTWLLIFFVYSSVEIALYQNNVIWRTGT